MNFVSFIIKKFFAVSEDSKLSLGHPRKILVIRQHNQLGDLLAGISLFKSLKKKLYDCEITLVVSPANYAAVSKNKYIKEIFVFDKKRLLNPLYLRALLRLLRKKYDLAIVPATVSISFTSNFLARLSNSSSRLGVRSLNGKMNEFHCLFDKKVDMDWRKQPDSNVADFTVDILRPFGFYTDDYSSEISFDKDDIQTAKRFINDIGREKGRKLIGLHVGAGKPPNRWSVKKYVDLIKMLDAQYPAAFYLTGSDADKEELDYVFNNCGLKMGLFLNRRIPEVAALISLSDLFITNDTGIMHVAGATKTPQISIFGPTNPYNWAPIGKNKKFLWKSDLIDDITVEDVMNECKNFL